MKKIIITIIAIVLLLGAGTLIWQEAFKRGNQNGLMQASSTIVEYLKAGQPIPFSVANEKGEIVVIKLIPQLDEKGQIVQYKPQ